MRELIDAPSARLGDASGRRVVVAALLAVLLARRWRARAAPRSPRRTRSSASRCRTSAQHQRSGSTTTTRRSRQPTPRRCKKAAKCGAGQGEVRAQQHGVVLRRGRRRRARRSMRARTRRRHALEYSKAVLDVHQLLHEELRLDPVDPDDLTRVAVASRASARPPGLRRDEQDLGLGEQRALARRGAPHPDLAALDAVDGGLVVDPLRRAASAAASSP